MVSTVSKEKFIRTLRHYLEINEHKLLSHPDMSNNKSMNPDKSGIINAVSSLWSGHSRSASAIASNPHYSTNRQPNADTNTRPTSLYGVPIPYMSLLSASSPNATSLSNTPYMPIHSLTLDIHYLYFILVQFDYFGLESFQLPIPEDGLVETETTESAGSSPSIVSSVGSVVSTMSLSTGWQFWSKQSNKQERPLHDDIRYIHRYLSRVSALKLHMNLLTQNGVTRSGMRTIQGYDAPIPQDGSIALPLHTFKHLSYLELSNIHPSVITSWSDLQQHLVSLVIKSSNIDNAVDIIGHTPWPHLKMLSLADNSLTTLDHDPSLQIGTLTHLNLSSNLLIDAPASLSNLYNLSSLNLSYNMISYTSGINVVLGNIQELDLRGNRLTVLAGLDRLWALERLDVRDNRIDDHAEIGRLTSLPNIHDIWIEGNPFTRIQSDYRVSIFNTFKKYDLDIELDGTKPSFTERLRIQTQPQHHSSHPPPIPAATVINDTPVSTDSTQGEPKDLLLIPKAKKLARAKTKDTKRIIRLGQKDKLEPPAAVAAQLQDNDHRHHVHRLAELEQSVQKEAVNARRATSMKSRRSKASSDDAIKAKESVSESTRNTSNAFRRKIEAMRKEAGTEWLRVLQEMDVTQNNKPLE